MNTKLRQILLGATLTLSVTSTPVRADESSPDWRTYYKSMVGAYFTGNYSEAIDDAKTCLDKVACLTNQTEKNVALDELIKYLNMIGGQNGRQQNYPQQELVLKCKLRAYEAKTADDSANGYQTNFQITQIRKELATCLVLQGKSKEAEAYLNKQIKPSSASENLSGWKKDLDLLSIANGGRRSYTQADPDKLCEYATNAVNDALSIKNDTEREVAFNQIGQQLGTAQYKYKNDKDYPHEEKVLKLQLKLQEIKKPENDGGLLGMGMGLGLGIAYSRISTLQELVTCLVMENKDDEAAEYNKLYKEETDKMMKNQQKIMKSFMDKAAADKAAPAIESKENKSADKKE